VVAAEPWIYGYSVMEKIQMTSFCVQEVTMRSLDLIYTRKLTIDKRNTAIVQQTLYLNALVLCLDLAMLICEYVGLYEIQIMLKVVVCTLCLFLKCWGSLFTRHRHGETQAGVLHPHHAGQDLEEGFGERRGDALL
jgi:hypothetical protein